MTALLLFLLIATVPIKKMEPTRVTGQLGVSSFSSLIPTPAQGVQGKGMVQLIRPTISVAGQGSQGLDRVLAGQIELLTGVKVTPAANSQRPDIQLRIAPGMRTEGYRLNIGKQVEVSASSTQGLSWGCATLLQLASSRNGKLIFPKGEISDHPDHPYRGLLIDVARRWHSISVLKQCIEMCHFYKLNFLQLHLSDDQSFTIPSQAYPQLNRFNQHGGPSYTKDELIDLVEFARLRGVTIVPELEIPGHAATLIRAMPDLFKIKGTKPYEHHGTINFVNKGVLKAIDTLVGEVCEIFKTSPYFHMGGDEADISLVDQHPDFQSAFSQLGLPPKSQQELFRRFIVQVDEMVKQRGKQLIVWEGFGRDKQSRFAIPKDVLVMEFENAYYLPNDLLADGYKVVNASWTPLYVVNRHVWPAEKVYEWSTDRFGRFSSLFPITEWTKATNPTNIIGAQLCSWEGPEELEITNLRRLAAAFSERTWRSQKNPSLRQFGANLQGCDTILEKLVHSVQITSSLLDASDPNGFDVPCFTKPLTLTLSGPLGCLIRYTTNGRVPDKDSKSYTQPISLTSTTTIRAVAFTRTGEPMGYESAQAFYYVAPRQLSLAFGKKVTASGGTQGGQVPELVVDDNLDLASSWWAGPAPQWLQVDLGQTYSVNRMEVFPYWDGSRYYQYKVEASQDGQSWFMVAVRSTNTIPAKSEGDEISFESKSMRYVKVTMLRGSANDSVHLVELKVWQTPKTR